MGSVKAYLELAKPRIALLVLAVAAASFFTAAPGAVSALRLAGLTAGIGFLAAGIFALNHYLERETDRLMRRTARRPLPSGRLLPRQALAFGIALSGAAFAVIFGVLGWLAGALALFTFASYLFVYTPLKRRTPHHTVLGALSGATPPLLGWAAARGTLDPGAWVLFAILFLWQFPHFLAIEMLYRDDYAAAGIKVLPVTDPTGAAAVSEILVAQVLLAGVSLIPFLIRMAGLAYLVGGCLLAVAFLGSGLGLAARRGRAQARLVLLASVTYLPLIFFLMALDAPR
jgi:protoheme IX farnesyltransferase